MLSIKLMKIFKKFLKIFFLITICIIAVLIINNRIYYLKYNKIDVDSDTLSKQDIERVHNIYSYLADHELLNGFNGKSTDLIIYNEKYQFLFTEQQEKGEWTYLNDDNKIAKHIYRRDAKDSKAFALKVDDRWVGYFDTYNYYNKAILSMIPIIYPPQIVSIDDEYYKAIVIHEMAHAFQGNSDNLRVEQDEHYHDIGEKYYSNKQFDKLIKEEGKNLEKAINTNNSKEIKEYVQKFIKVRNERRTKCHMTINEINQEKEFEWLEGIGRYVEYKSSRNSNSIIAKNLANIEEKTGCKADDRYYTLGMAEIIIMDRLGYQWREKAIKDGYTLEECLKEAIL